MKKPTLRSNKSSIYLPLEILRDKFSDLRFKNLEERKGTIEHKSGRHVCFFTSLCLHRRWRVCRAACVDAGCEKPQCHRAPGGKTKRAGQAHDGASRGERDHRGLAADCRQESGNKLQVRRWSGQHGSTPIYEGCNRRCSVGQLLRGARVETCPWLSRHGKLQGPPDTPKYIARGDTAGVAFVNSRP
jgi:hypothetical protein